MCVYRYYGWLYISGFVPCTRHSGRVICFLKYCLSYDYN